MLDKLKKKKMLESLMGMDEEYNESPDNASEEDEENIPEMTKNGKEKGMEIMNANALSHKSDRISDQGKACRHCGKNNG